MKNVPPSPWMLGLTISAAPSLARNDSIRGGMFPGRDAGVVAAIVEGCPRPVAGRPSGFLMRFRKLARRSAAVIERAWPAGEISPTYAVAHWSRLKFET